MSTPTDPYSRPDHEDGHDDILDPLPQGDDSDREGADSLPEVGGTGEPDPEQSNRGSSHDSPQDSPFRTPEAREHDSHGGDNPVSGASERADSSAENAHRGDAKLSDEPEFTESEAESTRSWSPNFSDEPDAGTAPKETERERWEREFGNTGGTGSVADRDETTVVRDTSDSADTTVTAPAATAPAERPGSYPNRTSVFNRVPADSSTSATPAPTTVSSPATVSTPPESPYTRASSEFHYEEPIPEEPRGRGWSHVGVFFGTLLLAPLAWYLIADSGVRLTEIDGNAWSTGTVDWLVVLELLGALLCVGVLWFLASYSSVGPIVIGVILLAAGALAIFAPALTQDLLASNAMQSFAGFNDFTGNVEYHLTSSLATGRLAVYGFLLLMTGVVSHQARRHGTERGDIMGRRGVLLSRKSDS